MIEEQAIIEGLRRAMGGELEPVEAAEAHRAVDALFAANQDRVYAICYRHVRDPQWAAELAQDALLVAYRRLADFRGESSFGAWLYGICRNLCWRALEKRREVLAELELADPTDPTPSPLVGLRRQERVALLRDAARVLDPTEQEAVHLRFVQHAPLERIEALLDIEGSSGARGLLQRCKRKLLREARRLLAERGLGSSFVRGTVSA